MLFLSDGVGLIVIPQKNDYTCEGALGCGRSQVWSCLPIVDEVVKNGQKNEYEK